MLEIETATLAECEDVIRRAVDAWLEAGIALQVIRDRKLYQARYRTFEEYCRRTWDFGDSRARQLIAAAETVTVVTNGNSKSVPSSERVARVLAPLRDDPEELRHTWEEARVHAAESGRTEPTAYDVGVAVRGRALGPVTPSPQEPEEGSDQKVNDLIDRWTSIAGVVRMALDNEHAIFSEHDLTDNQRWRLTEAKRHVWMRLADEF
jgi:hypothetical protein